jgi:HSP20 family molecular chaperone IbpA
MPEVKIQKVNQPVPETHPLFAEIAHRLEEVRKRAYELFEQRGDGLGRTVADWLQAEREVFGGTAAEMSEKEDAYQVSFTLPGFDAKDVQVTATPHEIIVHAAKTEERKGDGKKVLWTEFGSKDVCRKFELPDSIDTAKVTAALEKGMLRITAHKEAAAQKRQISVVAA